MGIESDMVLVMRTELLVTEVAENVRLLGR